MLTFEAPNTKDGAAELLAAGVAVVVGVADVDGAPKPNVAACAVAGVGAEVEVTVPNVGAAVEAADPKVGTADDAGLAGLTLLPNENGVDGEPVLAPYAGGGGLAWTESVAFVPNVVADASSGERALDAIRGEVAPNAVVASDALAGNAIDWVAGDAAADETAGVAPNAKPPTRWGDVVAATVVGAVATIELELDTLGELAAS